MTEFDISKFKNKAKLTDRYKRQLSRLQKKGIPTDCIENAVEGTQEKLSLAKTSALVIYGEPQSGKTEMMICLTAKLLDLGHKIIIHLMNDSVDLLTQNLNRFRSSGLAPAPRNSSELGDSEPHPPEMVIFCKKNFKDLEKLISRVRKHKKLIIIDDEADYATPNGKVNSGAKTTIYNLIEKLIGQDGYYIGVTATPARLNLNNTFNNKAEHWVKFPPHAKYTGQDTFFPIESNPSYRLTLLDHNGASQAAENALIRFLVTSAYLNIHVNGEAENYSMLVHTSGRKEDHETDRIAIMNSIRTLTDSDSPGFDELLSKVYFAAKNLYPAAAEKITEYVIENASMATWTVINSERDRAAAGENATEPSSPFSIIIGGNIISRGVTFPNLLAMFFTRNVQHRLQQDTYIQRARMFGARGEYLKHFELTIPARLYADWHRCFVFHRLALATIEEIGSPVWIADKRIAVAAAPSIDKATVVLDKGEMAFGLFDYSASFDELILLDQKNTNTLCLLQKRIGTAALPNFLIDFIRTTANLHQGTLAIHTASSIEGYGASADQDTITRSKGFIGATQKESSKFPDAAHHIKILHNGKGKARLFYKYEGSLHFVRNNAI
ncbi:Z1 domain-containing protein [Pseudoduganella namucuonensis]|uniref:Z1 domain-containing protein n=1 Tax=Pseudoduganella namucuonensis TaxID=1035707 RepID=A0A1I7M0J6_9BURK|nr:Z1 domain-containing protein [Pseudoduganella namucuonensis]SFV15429.1 Z1 domain-containing protein [Pseudoduganella namucuonensis]